MPGSGSFSIRSSIMKTLFLLSFFGTLAVFIACNSKTKAPEKDPIALEDILMKGWEDANAENSRLKTECDSLAEELFSIGGATPRKDLDEVAGAILRKEFLAKYEELKPTLGAVAALNVALKHQKAKKK